MTADDIMNFTHYKKFKKYSNSNDATQRNTCATRKITLCVAREILLSLYFMPMQQVQHTFFNKISKKIKMPVCIVYMYKNIIYFGFLCVALVALYLITCYYCVYAQQVIIFHVLRICCVCVAHLILLALTKFLVMIFLFYHMAGGAGV